MEVTTPLRAHARRFIEDLASAGHLPQSEAGHLLGSRERLQYTLDWILRHGFHSSRILEIGLGPIGVCCRLAGAEVAAWDIRTVYDSVSRDLGIPLHHVDLNDPTWIPGEMHRYDLVICAEVIEHVYCPPGVLISRIRKVLAPGGIAVITTVNLARLSNRARLALGRELFAPFEPAKLVMGHLREYTLIELVSQMTRGGFEVLESGYRAWDLGRYAFLRPLMAVFPSLANYIWVVGRSRSE
jgi:SAM-dependent methyltransferase